MRCARPPTWGSMWCRSTSSSSSSIPAWLPRPSFYEKGSKVEGGYLGVVGGSGYPADDEADHYSVVGYLKYARSCSGVAEKSDSPTQ